MTSTKLFIHTLVILALAPIQSFAYIPSSSFILAKTAKNHGDGFYSVEQEVLFSSGQDSITLSERWIVADGGTMLLSVKGAGHKAQVLYNHRIKVFKDETGSMKEIRTPSESLETFFHVRSYTGFKDAILNSQILPSAFFENTKRNFRSNKDITYRPENLVRLSRSNGGVTYAFGQPTESGAQRMNPGIWIEQDRFIVRKIRFPSGAEVLADEYNDPFGSVQFPRQRVVTWNQSSVKIQLLRINELPSSIKTSLSVAAIAKESANRWPEHPLKTTIQEFYTRFR